MSSTAEVPAVELQDVVKRFGAVAAVDDISLQIHEGEFFSLLGPSGCGKTTTLRLIAGLEMPTSGTICIGGEAQGYRPAYQRPVNTVFQHYALFPHMTVHENVAFGLEMRRTPKNEIEARVKETLELVRLPGMEARRPDQLSGGQQQRVALARALVNHPRVLLLDEPLGALDLKLRKAMQVELKALQHQIGITFVYVTHDQEEALTMSDRIAVVNEGKILQVGPPEEIYENPSNRFVADFIGETNFIAGTLKELSPTAAIDIGDGASVTAGWVEEGLQVGLSAVLSIRPEKIQLRHPDAAEEALDRGLCSVPGQIEQVVYLGTDIRHQVRLPGGESLVARMQNVDTAGERFQVGDEVSAQWDPRYARVLKE